MVQQVLAVRTDELDALVGRRQFVGLPREETARFFAAIEVLVLDQAQTAREPTVTQLSAYAVIHHNYSWLTYVHGSAPRLHARRSMGLAGPLIGDGRSVLFLDDQMEAAALRAMGRRVFIHGGYESRLAGLISEPSAKGGQARLGLVYVARLREPGIESRDASVDKIRFCGNGDLVKARDEFDPWSQVAIDNLHAF